MSLTSLTTRSKLLTVGVLCAGAGASAGAVASATASTGSAHHAGSRTAHHARHHDLRGLARRSVQGDAVVWTKDGYRTVRFERGVVDSVNGSQITLTEGTAKHPYKQVTVTIPAGARIRDNGKAASLSSVSAGQRVLVLQGAKRTVVRAHTPKQGANS